VASTADGSRNASSPVAYAESMSRASWTVAAEVASSSLAIEFPSLVDARVPGDF
jgi:hypothetical protein